MNGFLLLLFPSFQMVEIVNLLLFLSIVQRTLMKCEFYDEKWQGADMCPKISVKNLILLCCKEKKKYSKVSLYSSLYNIKGILVEV